MGEVNGHPDFFRAFLGCDYNYWGAPLCRFSDWSNDVLFLVQLELIAKVEGDSTRFLNAIGFGAIGESNVEVLTLHRLDIAIEHHRVFVLNISWG